MNIEELTKKVDRVADEGLEACGCHASPRDRVFYAAQLLFPEAGEEAWNLMADFVMNEED